MAAEQVAVQRRPLDGLRVIEVSTFIAGPFCSTQLAEFGAEVIKIELPGVGDPLRRFGTPTPCGDTLPWLSECRNKKSGTLDLRKPQGAELLRALVRKADVLVENFQPGTLEAWGLGWEVLNHENPALVMVRISGYGQTGPYRGRPGFGRIANAFGGLSFLAGYPDRPPVTPGSATIPDYLAGLYGAFGAMLALKAREATGRGQVIDIGLYEPVFRILDELAPAFHLNGTVRQRMGPGAVNAVPHSHYPTKDGRWIAIACTIWLPRWGRPRWQIRGNGARSRRAKPRAMPSTPMWRIGPRRSRGTKLCKLARRTRSLAVRSMRSTRYSWIRNSRRGRTSPSWRTSARASMRSPTWSRDFRRRRDASTRSARRSAPIMRKSSKACWGFRPSAWRSSRLPE